MRAKDENGNFRDGAFDCYAWGRDYTEGSAWHSSFAVYHDIKGLDKLYGGRLSEKIDELVNAPAYYSVGGYGKEIHEMSEMACVDFGQMAISNQPSFHIPWLYVLCGRRDKASYWIEKLVKEAFLCDIEGFPGDEDNGTTSAWYVFACLGFYPVCPGKDEYVTAKPLIKNVKINGKAVSSSMPDVVRTAELFKN